MTSTIGSFSLTASPSFTNHLTTSPSWTPSPMSGSLNSRAIRLLSRCVRRKPRGHLNILYVPPRTRVPEMRMILWSLADVHTGRSRVVEEWHSPMRVWAYGLAVLATLITLVYVGYTAYQRSNSGEALSLAAILTLGIVGVIFVYLLAASRAFRRPAGTM